MSSTVTIVCSTPLEKRPYLFVTHCSSAMSNALLDHIEELEDHIAALESMLISERWTSLTYTRLCL